MTRVLETLCCLVLLAALGFADPEVCEPSKCPGPVRYYKALGCAAIYKNPGDCCAERYDCSHLEGRDKNKCYANGHEYEVNESLRDEDANPCDIGCFCREGYNGAAAGFVCAVVDCFFPPPKPDCFFKRSHEQCCQGPEVCLKEGEERAKCVVDGETYLEGDYFKPKGVDEDVTCYCMPGYTGENIEPFCKKPKRPYCDPAFRGSDDVHGGCAPVFYPSQSPQTDCNSFSRCPNENDSVVKNENDSSSASRSAESDPDHQCVFGNVRLGLGDELNDDDCVHCTCEVPPLPTCVRLDQCVGNVRSVFAIDK